jgi:signal transduction histidine kinase
LLNSLRARLSLLFGTIALAVVGFVYVATVPGLEQRLIDEKLSELATNARTFAPRLSRSLGTSVPAPKINQAISQIANVTNTRVTALLVASTKDGLQFSPTYDSFAATDVSGSEFPVGMEAAHRGKPATGSDRTKDGRVGQAAVPIFFTAPDGRRIVDYVVVFSAPLRDAESSVSIVRKRVLAAAAFALLLALVAGSIVARALSRRVIRLREAAQKVADGDFSARFPVDADDELGRLSSTLDDMRRQLAELDQARKGFIATASHELRTPIFSLGGFLELLQDEELDDETRDRFLTQVRGQVDRLGKLATDLLDLSRLEAGSLELRHEPTDLALLARSVASEFEPALQAHDGHLELRLPRGPLQAVCDPERVAQVVRILIDNAIIHTPSGTDMVVSAGRRDGHVRIGVGDFGPGIHRTMLPHIFEPFMTSDDAQGSGLGLAIAHELASRMDGTLKVDSKPGLTTFTLELPA